MQCGKILSTWSQGYTYYLEIIFMLIFIIFGIIIGVFSIHFLFGFIFSFIFILIGLFIGIFDISKGTPGKNTIAARLHESCYFGYSRPLGKADVKIEFNDKVKLLVLRYAYYYSPPKTFIPLTQPWQGWNLMFINDGKVYWGPDVSTVNYNRRDHVFMFSVIKRFRELNLEIEYSLLDPQYMDEFIEGLKKYSKESNSLKEILEKMQINEKGQIPVKKGNIYDIPDDIKVADITIKYEDLISAILSR